MAYTWTRPTTLRSIEVIGGYLVAEIGTYHKVKCKAALLSTEDWVTLTTAVKNSTPVRFGAFEPWSPYEWFIKIEPVEFKTNKVIVKSPILKVLIKHAVAWAMKDLNLSSYSGDKSLIISLDKYAPTNIGGYAKNFTKGNETSVFISVNYNREATSEILKVIFHEMVHFKRYVSGELKGDTWKGKEINTDVVPYRSLPWEIEAWAMMDSMLDAYISESLTERKQND